MKNIVSRLVSYPCLAAFCFSSCASKSVYQPELGREEIARVVHQHSRAVSVCYEEAIDARPGAMGKVVADFDITPDGLVQSAKLTDVDPTLEAIRPCLVGEISKWRFAPSTARDVTNVRYPFMFDERVPFKP